MVEHLLCKLKVLGSIPSGGTFFVKPDFVWEANPFFSDVLHPWKIGYLDK